jgi:class 3 adenylate cyclase
MSSTEAYVAVTAGLFAVAFVFNLLVAVVNAAADQKGAGAKVMGNAFGAAIDTAFIVWALTILL